MFKKFALGLVVVLGFTNQVVFAGNNSGEISPNFYKLGGDYLTIYADSEFIDDAACQGGTNVSEAVVLETSRDDFNELYAAVMLGFANDLKLAFWLDGSCSSDTQGGPFPVAISVYVVK